MTEEQKREREQEERKKKEMIDGMDFTYEELQGLDSVTKDDYTKKILDDDAQVQSYIQSLLKKI